MNQISLALRKLRGQGCQVQRDRRNVGGQFTATDLPLPAIRRFQGVLFRVISGDHRFRESNLGLFRMSLQNCGDFFEWDAAQQIEIHSHRGIGDLHEFLHHVEGSFGNADIVSQALSHLLFAVGPDQDR